jgi:DHA1 family bicyclomycin/chloramphenicol resistance-like MFS transporter
MSAPPATSLENDDLDSPSASFLALLVLVTALGPLSMQIFLPALPAIQADFGVSTGTAQLTLSLSMVSIAVSTLAYGPLSDRFGRRPVMLAGISVFLLGSAICVVAGHVAVLIVGRVIQAAGGSCGMVLSRAIVRDVYASDKVARMLAYMMVAMVVAPMVAPAIGGVLTDYISWRANFAFVGLVGLLVLAGVARRLTETHSAPPTHVGVAGMIQGMRLLLRSRRFNGFAFQGAFLLSVFFTFSSSAPYFMINVLGRPTWEYGLDFIFIAFAFMVGNFVAARVSARFGNERMVIAGSVTALAGTLVGASIIFSGYWTPWSIFGPGVVVAFGSGLSMPNGQAGALSVRPQSAGTASGLSGFLQMAISAVFAQSVGSLMGDTPYPMVLLMMLAATLAMAAIVLGLTRGREREPL